ncbi:hypothetical protein [Hyphobacterium marinum]|uniref:DUF306 domain-containing protein n=1 Tax=Hyphobacterium marinum TaxID=3116574 RepID=A0ABU7LYT0_9PROT|nr:hypothetical protein [Hyphobacterium sp. Y6023]MEE2566688.1 hypothetical protein [Hyphobacterium sp. Y6023]
MRVLQPICASTGLAACGLDVDDPEPAELAGPWVAQGYDEAVMVMMQATGGFQVSLRCATGESHQFGGDWHLYEGLEEEARLRFSAMPAYDHETGRFCGPDGARPETQEWGVRLERRWPEGTLRLTIDRDRGYWLEPVEE